MRFIFDLTIIFILLICAYWMYVIIRSFFNRKNKKVKTKIVRISIVIILLLISSLIFYGSYIEPQLITVKTTAINLNKTTETEAIKIAFISDLHVGPYKQEDYLEKVVQKIIAEKPDLILLGGDYLFGSEAEAKYLAPLKKLGAKFSVYAVTGNHEFSAGKYGDKTQNDHTGLLRILFKNWGIGILDNDLVSLNVQGHPLDIYGIEDLWTKRSNLRSLMDYIDLKKTNILISHNPDIILDSNHAPFNLILSGHTHAGQIRLPYIGAIMPIPTILGREYDHGLFKFDNNYLYITAGLGESGVRARLFNPPEITIINLDL